MIRRIGDLIDVPPVQTVIRLDEGSARSREITSSFVCTADVAGHLTVLAGALQRASGTGFFLEGDFGSGKSHFLAAVSAWLDERPGAELLTAAHPDLGACKKTKRRFLPVDISLVNYRSSTPIERIVIAAIEAALAARGAPVALSPLARFRGYFSHMLVAPELAEAFRDATGRAPEELDGWFAQEPREAFAQSVAFLKTQGIDCPEALVEERHEAFYRALGAVREAGFDGMVLLIDELSEFFRSKPDPSALNEDARTLQLLGEIAGSRPLWIIAAVQESIERTGDIASATFRKIKDRFPVRFHLSTLHIRDLIGKRLVKHKEGAAEGILAVYEEYRKNFPGFGCSYELFRIIYPLHPETLTLLEGLGELFSQHRGIVDFVHARIAGDAGRAITGVLDRPATELIAPSAIFEHFAPRLAEISSFHLYPRHIVPHLDEVIARVIEGEDDRALARRLVRILVLYNIHPTAKAPSARKLAELCACMLAPHDPDTNVQFITEAILDPLAANSRFLAKQQNASDDALDAVYVVTTEEDHAGNLRARIEAAAAEIKPDDSRLMLEPLADLPAGMAWPGPELLRECVERSVTWRQTARRALVAFVQRGAEAPLAGRIEGALASGGADFAVAIVVGAGDFACPHTAVWRVRPAAAESDVLKEYFAAKTVTEELHSSNPSHAPLIPLAKDTVRRLEPAARQALLTLLYAGAFDGGRIPVDPSALQLKRFDRLLEAAAESLLEERYPRFKEIAPRLFAPSPRLYQRILDEFVCLGAISMSEARAKSLTEAIETLAAPLGLVEVKSGSYRLAPSLGDHPFLSYVFSRLRPAGATQREEFMLRLRTGPYGVPRETAEFLLVTLAQCGILSLLRQGRPIGVDFLPLTAVDAADAVAPGEIIAQADRDTLRGECAFLAPQDGWATFGLRQQREAWQAVVKMKNAFQMMLAETARQVGAMAGYAAFASFEFEPFRQKAEALGTVLAAVNVSYQAREGLERFLSVWRASGLVALDVDLVRKMHRFLTRSADTFIYIAHYMRHQSVRHASGTDAGIAQRRDAVAAMLADPMHLVVPDEGVQLGAAFELFRERYAALYLEKHLDRCAALRPPILSKAEQRMAAAFTWLARVEQLDRPAGLEELLRRVAGDDKAVCARSVAEELLRSPSCGCGFQLGDAGSLPSGAELSAELERCFFAYRAILGAPAVLEALAAHAFALRDMNGAAASRLDKLCSVLGDVPAAAQPLLDLLDEQTVAEVGRALSGSMKVENRSLGRLFTDLAGRRLTARKIRDLIDAWTGPSDDATLLAIDNPPAAPSLVQGQGPAWWKLLHPELAAEGASSFSPDDARRLERGLEELFPAAGLPAATRSSRRRGLGAVYCRRAVSHRGFALCVDAPCQKGAAPVV